MIYYVEFNKYEDTIKVKPTDDTFINKPYKAFAKLFTVNVVAPTPFDAVIQAEVLFKTVELM